MAIKEPRKLFFSFLSLPSANQSSDTFTNKEEKGGGKTDLGKPEVLESRWPVNPDWLDPKGW